MDRTEAALALSAVALVPAVFSASLPPASTVATMPDDQGHQARSLRQATATAAVAVLGVAWLTRSPAVLVLGGLAIGAQVWLYAPAVIAP